MWGKKEKKVPSWPAFHLILWFNVSMEVQSFSFSLGKNLDISGVMFYVSHFFFIFSVMLLYFMPHCEFVM